MEESDWQRAVRLTRAVLSVDPANEDARTYLAMAESGINAVIAEKVQQFQTSQKWPPERVARLIQHVGGRLALAHKSHLSYAQITRMLTGAVKTKPHELTIMALNRVASEESFRDAVIEHTGSEETATDGGKAEQQRFEGDADPTHTSREYERLV